MMKIVVDELPILSKDCLFFIGGGKYVSLCKLSNSACGLCVDYVCPYLTTNNKEEKEVK